MELGTVMCERLTPTKPIKIVYTLGIGKYYVNMCLLDCNQSKQVVAI